MTNNVVIAAFCPAEVALMSPLFAVRACVFLLPVPLKTVRSSAVASLLCCHGNVTLLAAAK